MPSHILTPIFLVMFIALPQIAPNVIITDTEFQTEWGPQSEPESVSNSTTCGGILTGNTGTISYKPEAFLSPNERCVWILRGTNVTDYHIAVINLGFSSASIDHQITFMGIGGNSTHQSTYTVPETPGLYTIEGKTVAIITLHTGPGVETVRGCLLQYVATNNGLGTRLPAPISRDFTLTAGHGHLKYPEVGNYSDNEVTTFALLPPNNTYSPLFTTDIEFIINTIEIGLDQLNIYAYNSTTTESTRWKLIERVDTKLSLRSDDLILAAFTTDRSVVGEGFEIYYSSCNGIRA